jgi:hypothetical protein
VWEGWCLAGASAKAVISSTCSSAEFYAIDGVLVSDLLRGSIRKEMASRDSSMATCVSAFSTFGVRHLNQS